MDPSAAHPRTGSDEQPDPAAGEECRQLACAPRRDPAATQHHDLAARVARLPRALAAPAGAGRARGHRERDRRAALVGLVGAGLLVFAAYSVLEGCYRRL
jgi:hypothetical protein